MVAKRFIHRLPPAFRAALRRFDVLDSREYREVCAKRERVLIASAFAECSGLQLFSCGGFDCSAGAEVKGTQCRPEGLRKLALALKESRHLRRVFC